MSLLHCQKALGFHTKTHAKNENNILQLTFPKLQVGTVSRPSRRARQCQIEKFGERSVAENKNCKKEQLAFIDRTSKEYLEDLKRILPKIKGHYILTLEHKMKFPSPYSKLLIHSHTKMFGFHPKSMLYSNKPLEIQIPQIIDYV